MKESRLKSMLEPVTPQVVRKLLHPGILWRNWQRGLGDETVVCKVSGLSISLGVSSEMERFRARTYATKEPDTIAWLNSNLRPGDVVFDIGANIGLYALYAAKREPAAKVYAFEPESQNYARLCRNVRLNRSANIMPCNIAICGEPGFGTFDVQSAEPGAALHGMAGTSLDPSGKPPVLRQGVATAILDVLVTKYGIPQPTIIKVDVDGVEEQIFANADQVLSNKALRSVLVEINVDPNAPSPIELLLPKYGFELTGKSDWSGRFGNIVSKNYIFTRS